MPPTPPAAMWAVAIDRFGGPDELRLRQLPVPEPAADEVLVRLDAAGIGEWDPFERDGGYAELLGFQPRFPLVLGSEGAGTIAAVGAAVAGRLRPGEPVLAVGFLNPRGGFYAGYVAVPADLVVPRPAALTTEQAAVVGGVGLTALRGLEDVLALRPGETVAIVGASGGLGHLAVQLADRLGAQVVAVASGPDGVALARRLGAAAALDGRAEGLGDDLGRATRALAPGGLDAALLTVGGDVATQVLAQLRPGGRAAYPSGVAPVPDPPAGVEVRHFDGDPDADVLDRLRRHLDGADGRPPLHVEVQRTYALAELAEAHRALGHHHLGKLAVRTRPPDDPT